MAQVVMLTSLAGEGIDIVTGDVCECSPDEAARLIDLRYARDKSSKGEDDQRPVKSLPSSAKTAEPAKQPTDQPTPKPTRKRGKKDAPDASDSKGEEADPS